MSQYSTTKMSSRGQVVIPEEIRESLHLKEGDQFIVMGHADTVILRSITPPSMDELKGLMAQAEEIARKAEMKKKDLNSAIKKVRRKK
jgi:AbrB family looped-hinge helix DNA binding protein